MGKKKILDAWRPYGAILQAGFDLELAEEIHKLHPTNHTIISCLETAKQWARKHNAVVIEELVEGVFDSIFIEDLAVSDPLLSQGRALVVEIEQQFPDMVQMRYTDSELDTFCQAAKKEEGLSRFLSELEQKGQITAEQKKRMMERYHLKEGMPPVKISQAYLFVKACLDFHTRKGSRIACLLPIDFADSRMDEIVVDPYLETKQIEISQNTFLLVIEKLS